MRITTIINGKGGVGKTTTAHALATGLDRTKYKTLAIDYDPQGNLSHAFGAETNACPTMYHVFNGEISIEDAIQHTEQGDIIAANAWLGQLEGMMGGPAYLKSVRKLRQQLDQLTGYTNVFIDNQPLIGGILTTQSLAAADDLIVPMAADVFALQGLARLDEAIRDIVEVVNPGLKIDGILLTKYNPRTLIASGLASNITLWAEGNGTRVYQTYIRESVSVREAQAKKTSLFDYAPSSNPAVDYRAFVSEYLAKEG